MGSWVDIDRVTDGNDDRQTRKLITYIYVYIDIYACTYACIPEFV